MLLSTVRRFSHTPLLTRIGARIGLAGVILLGASHSLQNAIAKGDTRTLSFHHLHTGEDITITYKRNGRYDEAALKKLDWFMRDWRKQEAIHMDPQLFDVLWDTYRDVHAAQPIQVVCGYRSPATNAMLRARSRGVAQFSQHMLGHAMDFFIPGVPLEKVREIGLQLQRGGVGFYPTSGSPFVHLDTGSVRYWPRMTYAELAKVFPRGHTVHVAADGRTLPGYAQALAEIKRRGKIPNANSLEAARDAGVITASETHRATTVAEADAGSPVRTFFESLFGLDEPQDETSTPAVASKHRRIAALAPAAPRRRGRPPTTLHPQAVAATATSHEAVKRLAARHVPLPTARPRFAVAIARPPKTVATASLDNNFDRRGIWTSPVDQGQGGPATAVALVPPFAIAALEPAAIGGADKILSYAPTSTSVPAGRVQPMAHSVPLLAQKTRMLSQRGATSVLAKAPLNSASHNAPIDDPWIRAALLAPTISGFMTATPMGPTDMRMLAGLMYKPSQSVSMAFSADPASGMRADRFTGAAVVFLATTSFTRQRTASLQ